MARQIDKIKKTKDKLFEEFNKKSSPTKKVNGAGISSDEDGEYIKIYLEKELSAKERKKMPVERDGFRIKYEVIGQIKIGL